MNDAIIALMTQLSPALTTKFTEGQQVTFIGISRVIIPEDVDDSKKDLALALLTLDMLSSPERSNISSTSIGSVSISYKGASGISKWKELYNSLINGQDSDDLQLLYRGI